MRLVMIAAQSLDGFITRHAEPGVAWASAADQKWFRSCLTQFDCQVMGRVTYETVRTILRAREPDGVLRQIMTHRPDDWADDARPGMIGFTDASPHEIVRRLGSAGKRHCAILGGAQVHDAFLHAGLIDELWVTVEPCLFGAGTPLISNRTDVRLRLLDQTRLEASDSIVLRYEVAR